MVLAPGRCVGVGVRVGGRGGCEVPTATDGMCI